MMDEAVNVIEWVGECMNCGHEDSFLQPVGLPTPSNRSACEKCRKEDRNSVMFWVRLKK